MPILPSIFIIDIDIVLYLMKCLFLKIKYFLCVHDSANIMLSEKCYNNCSVINHLPPSNPLWPPVSPTTHHTTIETANNNFLSCFPSTRQQFSSGELWGLKWWLVWWNSCSVSVVAVCSVIYCVIFSNRVVAIGQPLY